MSPGDAAPGQADQPAIEMLTKIRTSWPLSGALLLLSLAACDDGTGPSQQLTPQQVAGRYGVCELRFVPEGAQPEVNISSAALEPGTAELQVDANTRTFELEYVPKGGITDRELGGEYDLGAGTITLRLSGTAASRDSLLLPERVTLGYQESPRQLSVAGSSSFEVPRSHYARLAGISETGLADRIPGRLHARFASPCG